METKYVQPIKNWRSAKNLSEIISATLSKGFLVYNAVIHEKTAPPKYNGVVFEIPGKHHWKFYNRI